MLPFLKRKEVHAGPGLIVEHTAQNEPSEIEDPSAAHEACARHLLLAIESKDVKAIADALYDAFTVMGSEEKSSPAPHSYDAQNIKAGENE